MPGAKPDMRGRDNQRSRVYAWERAIAREIAHRRFGEPEFRSLDECRVWADPIWRKERGRMGLARAAAPSIERPSWGQRRALAHDDHRITLPRWARSRWVILHEMAHRLTPHDEAHGPRFVGVLIGLVCRWLDFDASQLMRMADERRVRYYVRSVGSVPVHGPAWHVGKVLVESGRAMTPMEIACDLEFGSGVDLSYKQVVGAALTLVRAGKVRWRGRRLSACVAAAGSAVAAEECGRPRQELRSGVR